MRPLVPQDRHLTVLDNVAIAVVCVTAILGPLLLGGTGAVPRFTIECAMATAILLWAIAAPRPRLLMLVPLATAAVCLIQTIPLPPRLLEAVAPLSFTAWQVARGGLGRSVWNSVSMDPGATAIGVRRLFLALSTIAMVADLARHLPTAKSFTFAMAVSGLVICTLGIVFSPKEENRLMLGFYDVSGPIEYWKTPVHEPGQTAGVAYPVVVNAGAVKYFADDWIVGDRIGPYIVSNHFAGALVLTMPAAAAIWLLASGARVPLTVRLVVLPLMYALPLYAVALKAKSRAGSGALMLALLIFTTCVVKPVWLRRVIGVTAAITSVGILCVCAAMYGLMPHVEELFPAALQPAIQRVLQDQRAVAARVALRIFAAAPVFGTGIDTYGNLYPRFTNDDHPLYFAHNDYAQLLSETGLVGLGLAAVFGAVLLRSFVQQAQRTSQADWLPQAGAWAALAGIAAHSLFDWNMHVPANAFLTCVALGIALAGLPPPASSGPATRPWTRFGFAAAVLLTIATLARDTQSQRVVGDIRHALASARMADAATDKDPPYDQLRNAIEDGTRMLAWDPANAALAVLVGQAYLHTATELKPIDDVAACLDAADRSFQAARRKSAICRGLPIE